MTKLAAATAVTMLAASGAFAQDFDLPLGSENLTTMEPSTPDPPIAEPAPALLAPACEIRRMQFEDASGWRVRAIRVCCDQGQCTQELID